MTSNNSTSKIEVGSLSTQSSSIETPVSGPSSDRIWIRDTDDSMDYNRDNEAECCSREEMGLTGIFETQVAEDVSEQGEKISTAQTKRRTARSTDEKCAEILYNMTHRDKISFATLLEYVCDHRKERPVQEKFRQLKKFISNIASLDMGVISISEWKLIFDEGLWTVAHSLLRQEIISVAQLEEIGGNIDDQIEDRTFRDSDPIIPVDAIQTRASRMIQLLNQISQPLERTQSRTQVPLLRVTYMIANICHLQQRRTCETIPVALGLFLKANGLRRKGIDILNRWGICCSYNRLRRSQRCQMQRTQAEIRNMKDAPCLNITIDNWDISDGVSGERMGEHGAHTSATTGLINRGIEMPEDGLTQDMLNLQHHVRTSDILPAGIGHKSLPKLWHFHIFNAIHTAFQDVVRKILPNQDSCLDIAFAGEFKRPVEEQIHAYTTRNKTLSHESIPLETILINESTTEGMLQILDNIMVKQVGNEEEDSKFNRRLFLIHGDQKTVDRLRSCRRVRGDDTRSYDSMKWALPCLGLWHAKFNYLMLIHENHWSAMPSMDDSTLRANAAFWGRRKLQEPKDFKALEELEIQSFQARIVAMFMHNVLELDDRPRKDEAVVTVARKLKEMSVSALKEHIERIYNDIHENKHRVPDGRTPDQELWNHILYLRNMFPYLLLKDGIKYGDIGILRIAIAIMCVFYQGTRNSRYAKEFLHLFALTSCNGAAAPALQRAVLANSLVNHRGLQASHFEKDRELEFHNRHIKDFGTFNRTSRLPAALLLKKAALIAPQSKLIGSRLAIQTNYKDRTLHPEKSPVEDVLTLGLRLWEGSIAPKRGRDSTFVAQNFRNVGLQNLEPNVYNFNDDLARAAMAASGLVAVGSIDLDEMELEINEQEWDENHADDYSYRAQLHEETESEGSQFGTN